MPLIRGVIFDLDGTLIDSGLDFATMRREMGLSPGQPILETLETMPEARRRPCEEILQRHEREGARRATPMPGVNDFLERLVRRSLRKAILSRNSRESIRLSLGCLDFDFDPVIAREDAKPKPAPDGIHRILDAWKVEPREVLLIGDFLFDLQAGRRAGVRTAFFTRAGPPNHEHQADFTFGHFEEAPQMLTCLLDESPPGP